MNINRLYTTMKILRPGIGIRSGGLGELLDTAIQIAFNISIDEYEFIAENATDEELDRFLAPIGERTSFSVRRKAMLVRNKYSEMYRGRTNTRTRKVSKGSPSRIVIPVASLDRLIESLDDLEKK